MREQWVGIDYGDEFTVTEDVDGYPAVQIKNRVWAGEEDRWITVGSDSKDQELNVRALADALTRMADRMSKDRGRR